MTALEMDIMLEVVNRIQECSKITPVTDWLLNRMTAIGMSKKRIKEILREGVKLQGSILMRFMKLQQDLIM